MRKIKSIISLVLALILACAAALPISAAGPIEGDSLYINTHIDAINSATGKNYLSDTGDTMDFLKLKAYDQNPVYCIEKGARFTRTLYKAQTLANSAYWKKLTEKAREGIALAAAFGYPAQSYSALGVPSADDAYTATQFIIWEYQQGLRTAPDEQIADRRYRAKIAGTPAETAYKNILSNIRKYISDPQYGGNTQNLYGFVQLTSGSTSKEQEIICFYGETPKLLEKGYIEVYKKDTDGNLLDGAEFSVYNSSGAYVTKIGPTVNGYARSAEITLGTYKVVETKFPQNYRKYDKDTWTVTLNSGSTKFTINAVNEIVPGACRIIKASEDGVIAGVSFRITGNGTDETAKTNENGEIIFSSLKPGRYTVTEDTEDKYIPQESKAVTVVTGETAVVTFSNVLKKGSLKVTKTAEDGFKDNFTFRLTGTSYSGLPVNEYAVTNNDGEAVFENVLIGTDYVLEEINTPARYVVPESQTALIEWNKVTDISVSNTLKKWRADVCKFDGELNKEGAPQGNASLKGAVYGLYKGGQLTATYTTDENGRFVTDYYVCADDWTIREIHPSTGYLLDDTVYKIDCRPGKYTLIRNTEYINVFEQVIKGRINIIKHSDDGSTKIETPETGAEFEVFLKSAGSYASSKKSERDRLKTDKYGFAETKPLPYGVYTVKQVSGTAGAELIKPFDVYINADGEAYRYIINNAAFKAFIDIVKKDATTGKVIPAAGVGFKVKNLATGKFLVQHVNYPTPMDIDVFYTDSNGRLRLPEKLSYGDYAIIEQCTAEGYILDSEPVKFTVDGTQDTVTVEKLNYPQMGTLTVTKEGEIFSSVHEKDGLYIPKYETAGLKNAEFSVFAAEDIYTPDGTLRCAKGEKADSIITGEGGKATTKPLFLGKYEIRETKAPNGYVLTNEPVYAELKYAGQEVKITSTAVSVNNKRQKAVIRLRKSLEKDKTFALGNVNEYTSVKFGLFAAERLTAADGSEIPADGLLEVISVDENGNGIFTADIPVGAKLYVKETATDGHYILSDKKYPVEFTYSGQDISSVQLIINGGKVIENRIIRGRIDGIKTDENLNPIEKAVFGLFKPDETVFTESTALAVTESDENGAFSFTGIPYGKWIIKELSCPDCYVLSDKLYEVNITEDGAVLSLAIKNKTVTGTVRVIKLSKADISRKLHGAEFYIYSDTDNNGVFDPETDSYIGRLEEAENGVYSLSKLKFGGYFLYENKAPDGYKKDDRYFYFQIKKDGEAVTVENEKGVGFVNVPIPIPEVPSSPKTGDISNPLVFIIIGLSALFVSSASLIFLRKKSGKE